MGFILLCLKDRALVKPLSAILRVLQKESRALPIPEYTTHTFIRYFPDSTHKLRLQISTAMFRTNLSGDKYVNAGGLSEIVSADVATNTPGTKYRNWGR